MTGPVILLGYRASGKSTVGSILAERLTWPFFDMDRAIRARFGGKAIARIFALHGERAFRDVEAERTVAACAGGRRVIALGGGSLIRPETRRAVAAAHGFRAYLRCAPETLEARIRADTATRSERPDLTRLGGGVEEIRSLLAEREPAYRAAADRVIDADDRGPEEVARDLEQTLRRGGSA